jgi:hypothetical protein
MRRMANIKQPEGLGELLIDVYEILKRHEKILIDLSVDVEGLKAVLSKDDHALFEQARAAARFESALGSEALTRLYDERIRQLRGT